MEVELDCVLMRGGTSKGVFLKRSAIPDGAGSIDALLLALMGSPDARQIDGLGGATSTTSKVMIVEDEPDDKGQLPYTFAQVSVDRAVVDYGGNCGNLTSAVAAFAVDEGLWAPTEPTTSVRLLNTNTDKVVEVEVPTVGGRARREGDYRIAGVRRPGAQIVCKYLDPGGSVFDAALPTGSIVDEVELPSGATMDVSIVDVTNPLAFVRAADLGLAGSELPASLDQDEAFLAHVEMIRGAVAVRLGLATDAASAAEQTPGIPKLAFVAPPATSVTSDGEAVGSDDIDLLARIMLMQRVHPAYALTGIMCTAAAALAPGSIVHEAARIRPGRFDGTTARLTIGHPKGTTDALVGLAGNPSDEFSVAYAGVSRTARRLFKGTASLFLDPPG